MIRSVSDDGAGGVSDFSLRDLLRQVVVLRARLDALEAAAVVKLNVKPSATVNGETIRDFVAFSFGLEPAGLVGRCRTEKVVWPRHVAMFLTQELTRLNTIEIGELYDGRDHALVMYAVKKVRGRCQWDSVAHGEVSRLRRDLQELFKDRGAKV